MTNQVEVQRVIETVAVVVALAGLAWLALSKFFFKTEEFEDDDDDLFGDDDLVDGVERLALLALKRGNFIVENQGSFELCDSRWHGAMEVLSIRTSPSAEGRALVCYRHLGGYEMTDEVDLSTGKITCHNWEDK